MLPRGQTHAFGQGLIFPHPSRVTDPAQLEVFRAFGLPIWNRFLALSTIDPSVILGSQAWLENLSGDPRRVTKTGSVQTSDPATDPADDEPDTDDPAAEADETDSAQADQQD